MCTERSRAHARAQVAAVADSHSQGRGRSIRAAAVVREQSLVTAGLHAAAFLGSFRVLLLAPFRTMTGDPAVRPVRLRQVELGIPHRLLPAQASALRRSQPSWVHVLGLPVQIAVDHPRLHLLGSSFDGGIALAAHVAEGLVLLPRCAAAAVRRQVQDRRRRDVCSRATVVSPRSHCVTLGGSVEDASVMSDGFRITRFNGTRATDKLRNTKRPSTTTIHGSEGGGNPFMRPTV